MRFTHRELYDLLERYQSFHCSGIEITSPIHKAAPDLCRQLIETARAARFYRDRYNEVAGNVNESSFRHHDRVIDQIGEIL